MKTKTNIKALFLGLLFIINTSALTQAQENTFEPDFYKKSVQIQNTGMYILSGWALSNLANGIYQYTQSEGSQKYFGQMNALWNVVNLGIASTAIYKNKRLNHMDYDPETLARKHMQSERILLLNAAVLDLAYVATGFYLKQRASESGSDMHRMEGYGNALILQGSFLMVLDACLYGLLRHHRSQFNHKINISIANNGVRVRYILPNHS
jgi:hypothetical protein